MLREMQLRVPGKLMIAGEYAVLEPHQPAVVVAINRHVQATLRAADSWSVSVPAFGLEKVAFQPVAGGIHFTEPHPRLRFVQEGLVVSVTPDTPPFSLVLESELEEADGRKFGLGGSAAVVVATVGAVLHAHRLPGAPPPDAHTLFKLAAIAHFRAQGSGSGADVAASTFGGWLRYTSFQPRWLAARLARGDSPQALSTEPWPFFSVERLSPLPRDLQLCVGWTGTPASTADMLVRVEALKEHEPQAFEAFLAESQRAVEHLVAGLQSANRQRALDALTRNATALRKLGAQAGVAIATPALERLTAAAQEAGGAGKPSGAGGGDCGIALIFGEREAARLAVLWQEAGLVPLRLATQDAGITITRLVP
jgi:phosphomevalonate kinase